MPPPGKIGDRTLAAAQIAGVCVTAWFVWTHHILPRLGFESLGGILTQAALYVLLAWICGAFATFWVFLVVSLADLSAATRFSLRTSTAAMWYAPAVVLLSTHLPAAFAVSLLLTANATRQLISQWGIIESPIPHAVPAPADARLMFRTASPDASFSWHSAPVLAGSLSAQAGLVALLWHHPFRAAAFLAVSTAILTSLSIATGAYRPAKAPALPHSAISVVLTFLLAATLTFGGIAVRGRGFAGPDAASGPSGAVGAEPTPVSTDLPAASEDSGAFGGDFPGVILLPELKPYPTLFVPVPTSPVRFGAALPQPIGIPFSGAYWMFRWPAARPPRHSIVRRGSATDLSFHTTDGWPLEMEAHQKLEQPIDIHCCRQIQVAIRNADQFPGTVTLELLLMDTALPTSLGQSLGRSGPAPLLEYRIPPAPAISKFDDLKVVFHRDRIRADKSARIAIERFVLVP